MTSSARQAAVRSNDLGDGDDEDDPLGVSASPDYRDVDRRMEDGGRGGLDGEDEDSLSNGEIDNQDGTGRWIALGILFFQGGTMLLPWNTFITASEYFREIFKDGPYQSSFNSWLITLFTLSNLLCFSHAVFTQRRAKMDRRILISLLVTVIALASLASSAAPSWAETVAGNRGQGFFLFLMVLATVASGAGSYLQNSLIAFASMLGGSYVGAIMSGQGAIGVVIALVQLSAQAKSKTGSAESTDLRRGTFTFFVIATGFACLAIMSHLMLTRLEIYKSALRRHEALKADSTSFSAPGNKSLTQLKGVGYRLLPLALAIFWIFTITIAIFPALTTRIQSVSPEPRPLFVPMHFLVFNLFDFLGRLLPSIDLSIGSSRQEKIPWRESISARTLVLASLLRTLFIPLVASCNVVSTDGLSSRPWIASDTLYFLILAAMAFSNGALASLIMIKGPSTAWKAVDGAYAPPPIDADISTAGMVPRHTPFGDCEARVDEDEQDLAGTVLAFALTLGLLAGSLSSFLLVAWAG